MIKTTDLTPVSELLSRAWADRRSAYESSCRSGSRPGDSQPPPDPDAVIAGMLHDFQAAARRELLAIREAYFRPPVVAPDDGDFSLDAPDAATPNNRRDPTPASNPIGTLDLPANPIPTGEFDAARLHENPTVSLADPGAATGTAPGEPAAPPPKRSKLPTIPGFAITGVLGHGGMGVVYKARQLALNREVALKMILKGEHASPNLVVRFLTEARAVAALNHPHIVQVFQIDEHDGMPYFALEFCPGGSLDRQLNKQPQPPAVAAEYAETLARAVQAAHAAGVIHRDIKPANVLLAADGALKVTDFGLARVAADDNGLTGTGSILGSPPYMAPEQASGDVDTIGPHSDQYALGATLYEFLTGRPPFQGPTPMDTVRQVLDRDPVPPSALQPGVPKDLETICLKALAKDPAKRYPDAAALADDLRAFRDGRPISARPVGRVEKAWRWAKRNPRVAGLLAAVAGLLLALAAGGLTFTAVYRAKAGELATALDQSETNLREANDRKQEADANYGFARDVSVTLALEVPRELRTRVHDPAARLGVIDLITRSLLDRKAAGAVRQLPDRMLYTAAGLRGDARMDRNEIDAALADYDQAFAAAERMVATEPVEKDKADGLRADMLVKRAAALLTRADQPGRPAAEVRSDVAAGRALADEAVAVQRARVAAPRSPQLPAVERIQNLATALSTRLTFDTSVTDALSRSDEAVRLQSDVAAAPPTEYTGPKAVMRLATLHYQRSRLYRQAGRSDERKVALRDAIDLLTGVWTGGSSDITVQVTLARWNREMGDILFLDGDRHRPLAFYRTAFDLTRPFATNGTTTELEQQLAMDAYRAGLAAREASKVAAVVGGPAKAADVTAGRHFRDAFRRAESVIDAGRRPAALVNLAALSAGQCGELRHAERWAAEATAIATDPKQLIEAACCYAVVAGCVDRSPDVEHLSADARRARRDTAVATALALFGRARDVLRAPAEAANWPRNQSVMLRRLTTDPDLDDVRAEVSFQAFVTETRRLRPAPAK